jgi:hypothetical protein
MPFSEAIRRPKRKFSTQLDLRNSPLFSQNPLISTKLECIPNTFYTHPGLYTIAKDFVFVIGLFIIVYYSY